MSEKRQCTFKWGGEDRRGTFHQWGSKHNSDDGNHPLPPLTVGIVEDSNGQVWELEPSSITFAPDPRRAG